jgi:hypothetical protein
MKFKLAISALAACTLMSGAALADAPQKKNKNQNQSSSGSVAGGVAVAGPDGAGAAGVAGSRAQNRQMQRQHRKHGNSGQQAMTTQRACVPGTASTSTTGAAYTDRRTGSASIATNGTASGDGTVRSSSEGEVYSSTDKTGSQADAYGNSTAVAREPTTRPC